ncbi:MAG: stage III sporulation protein AB [Clostridia bacterium]|nr:stage III sporulation protein AB [Clostridia bacterium]
MLKFFGAVLIVSAFGIWGVSKSERLKKRCDSLLTIISSLNLLENEISYCEKDISSALLSVGVMENLPFFRSIAENLKNSSAFQAFSNALKNDDMCLSKSDREILLEFSQNLGSINKDFQISSILHTKELLASSRVSAYSDYEKYGKLYRNMGFLLGCLIALLMV